MTQLLLFSARCDIVQLEKVDIWSRRRIESQTFKIGTNAGLWGLGFFHILRRALSGKAEWK